MQPVTITISGPTTPERLIGELREQAPQVFSASGGEPLMTLAEVAAVFRVDPKTVTRWRQAGKLTSIRTPGGRCRYRENEVRGLLGQKESR